jgi:hypothetical protein
MQAIVDGCGGDESVLRVCASLVLRTLWPLLHSPLFAVDMGRVWIKLCAGALRSRNDECWTHGGAADAYAYCTLRNVGVIDDIQSCWTEEQLPLQTRRCIDLIAGEIELCVYLYTFD